MKQKYILTRIPGIRLRCSDNSSNRNRRGSWLDFKAWTVPQHSAQFLGCYPATFGIPMIIQLCRNCNGGTQREDGRYPYAWCACEWEHNLQPLAWIITQRVASYSRNRRWKRRLFSSRWKNATCSVANFTLSALTQACNQLRDVFKSLPVYYVIEQVQALSYR